MASPYPIEPPADTLSVRRRPAVAHISPADPAEAKEFLALYHHENPDQMQPLRLRLEHVQREIYETGTYWHTPGELAFGARVAWRNSKRCIGRLYWNSLHVVDRRQVTDPAEIHQQLLEHLGLATGSGRIRPVLTVFAPDAPGRPAPRVWNGQLIGYAAHRQPDGTVVGDGSHLGFTDLVKRLGWKGDGTAFDVLPLVIGVHGAEPRMFEIPRETILEVPLVHPAYEWFAELGLRWYAVPAISNMHMRIGGVDYPLAPFNGWYMGTEIGTRNLVDADRYDLLPLVAARLGLNSADEASLWRDRALVEINIAVLHSFRRAGVRMTDHHTESRRFLRHIQREEKADRIIPADWSWIVPPLSGGITPVYHRYYDNADLRPCFQLDDEATAHTLGQCPHLTITSTE